MKIADRVYDLFCIASTMKNGLKRRLKVLSFRIIFNYQRASLSSINGKVRESKTPEIIRRWVVTIGKYVCSDNFYGKGNAYCGLFINL